MFDGAHSPFASKSLNNKPYNNNLKLVNIMTNNIKNYETRN